MFYDINSLIIVKRKCIFENKYSLTRTKKKTATETIDDTCIICLV